MEIENIQDDKMAKFDKFDDIVVDNNPLNRSTNIISPGLSIQYEEDTNDAANRSEILQKSPQDNAKGGHLKTEASNFSTMQHTRTTSRKYLKKDLISVVSNNNQNISTEITATPNPFALQLDQHQRHEQEDQVHAGLDLGTFMEVNGRLWSVVFPAILSQLVLLMMETISMMFVGRLNNSFATAGVGLAIIFVNLTTHSTLMGLNNAISVLVPVAYGQCDYRECERVLNRGRILCLIFYAPLFFVQLSCFRILTTLGIDEEVARYAHDFGLYLFLAMGFHMQFDCYKQYLNGTNQSRIVQFAVSSTILIHLALCYTMTYYLDLEVVGVGIATMTTCFLNMLFTMLYTWKMTVYEVKPLPSAPLSLLQTEDLKIYMGISGPSILMLCADWWAYEAIVIMAATISVGAVGSMAISYNYLFLIYSFPCGFQIGAVSVIGNVIGEENEQLGKVLSMMSFVQSSLITIALGAATYYYASEIAYAYTEDSDTVFLLIESLKSLAISISILGFTLSLQGTLKALQKQTIASRTLLVSLYLVSLPSAYFLAIYCEVGITGLWKGFSVGQLFITAIYAVILYRTDWQAIFSINRMRKASSQAAEIHFDTARFGNSQNTTDQKGSKKTNQTTTEQQEESLPEMMNEPVQIGNTEQIHYGVFQNETEADNFTTTEH